MTITAANKEKGSSSYQRVTNAYWSEEFKEINEELRQHFGVAHQEVEKVKEKVNELVVLVHNDNKDWSIKKICDYIAGKNDDLEHLGFSAKTIYRYLNDENRQLIDSKRYKRQKGDTASKESQALKDFRETKGNTMLLNNVIEESE